MHYYFYGFDIYYLTLILPAFIISLIAQIKVKSTFSKYSNLSNSSGLTGQEAAQKVLSAHGIYDVKIEHVNGHLSDHFDPTTKVIRLSDSVFNSTSVAAIGVAAHEAGHAVQYDTGYAPIKIRNTLVPIVNFGSRFSWFAILFGILFSFNPLILAGIILFSFATVFQLITLPVEFNASKRALNTISEEFFLRDEDEIRGCRKVLSAAAMTYVAAVIMSVAQLIRLLAIFGRRRN